MKKLSVLILAAVLTASVFVLAACSPPGRIDIERFAAVAAESEFALEREGDYIITAALNANATVRFERHAADTYARERFEYKRALLRGRYNSFSSSSEVIMSGHGSWRFNSGGRHYLVQWVGTDFVFAQGLTADRSAINDFLDAVRESS